jgi:centrosomal protein CEP41
MEDERQGTHYAKLLFEKGFDNVYLLSGCLEKFLETHYELVEGKQIPELIKKKDPAMKTTKKSTMSTMGKSSVSFKK